MTKDKFIEQLDEAFSTANKLRAVKLLLDTRAVGGLKDSKEFIDEYYDSIEVPIFSSNSRKDIIKNLK